jgi:hypothetical protein
MKVKDLIKELEKHNPEKEVVLFAKGDNFPVLGVENLTKEFGLNVIELGGGWDEIKEETL